MVPGGVVGHVGLFFRLMYRARGLGGMPLTLARFAFCGKGACNSLKEWIRVTDRSFVVPSKCCYNLLERI